MVQIMIEVIFPISNSPHLSNILNLREEICSLAGLVLRQLCQNDELHQTKIQTDM